MITQGLHEEVLVKPVREGADALYIVSGFASGALAASHLKQISELRKHVTIRLIVGMFPQINRVLSVQSNHRTFCELATTDYPTLFECRYVVTSPPVHSKAYSWYRNGQPLRGYLGSANYTQMAFSSKQREAVTSCDAASVRAYFDSLWVDALDCREPEAEQRIADFLQTAQEQSPALSASVSQPQNDYSGLLGLNVSLTDKTGEVPKSSGLNWGVRVGKKSRRNKDEAYIHVPSKDVRASFFPLKNQAFTALTDDDRSLNLTLVSGEIGKDLHSLPRNYYLGQYFRNRLGLASGTLVTRQHLDNYGRTSVDFYKIDDETYYMDFSPVKK